jgi:hypothetical protein
VLDIDPGDDDDQFLTTDHRADVPVLPAEVADLATRHHAVLAGEELTQLLAVELRTLVGGCGGHPLKSHRLRAVKGVAGGPAVDTTGRACCVDRSRMPTAMDTPPDQSSFTARRRRCRIGSV